MDTSLPRRGILIYFLALVGLLFLILGPRWFFGWQELCRAEEAMVEGRFAVAAVDYKLAAQRLPWSSGLWEKAGHAALNTGCLEEAVGYFLNAADRGALSQDGWLALGDAYQQNDDLLSAMAAWEMAFSRYGPSVEIYQRLAQAHRIRGEYAAAIEDWQHLLTLNPDDADAYYQLGLILAATHPEEALTELMRAAQLDPLLDASVQALRSALNTALLEDDPAYRLVVSGRGLAALGKWDLADEAFRRAADLRPDYAEAWAWLGEAHQQLGQDGHGELETAIKLEPQSVMVQAMWGLYLQRQGQSERALLAFQQAAALEPENPAWQVALAGVYEQSGDLIAANEHYHNAAALDPQDPVYWRALAAFCLRNGDDVAGTALPAVLKLVTLLPDDWQSYDLAGQVIFELSDLPGAEALFLKAVEMAPEQAAPHLHLGLVYLQTGDHALAYDHLVKAHTSDPDGPYGWQAGRLLEQYFPGE